MNVPVLNSLQSVSLFVLLSIGIGSVAIVSTPVELSKEWDLETSMLVTNSVYRKVTKGWGAPLGYPFDTDGNRSEVWHSERTDQNYYKQFGLEVFVLAALAPVDSERMEQFLINARYIAAIVSSMVMAMIITLVARQCGMVSGVAIGIFIAVSTHYCTFLHSLYWLPSLSLLPMLSVLWLYSPSMTRQRLLGLLLLVGVAICARALCGYEHISVPVLTACASVVFCSQDADWRLLAKHSILFVLAGGVGIAVALLIHILSLYWMFGSVEVALNNTVLNAVNRSIGSHEAIPGANTMRGHLIGIYGVLAHNKPLTVLLGVWGGAVLGWLVQRKGSEDPCRYGVRLSRLCVSSIFAFLAACSWLVLMRVHVAIAPQFNGLVFFSGFVILAIPFVLAFVANQWSRVNGKRKAA